MKILAVSIIALVLVAPANAMFDSQSRQAVKLAYRIDSFRARHGRQPVRQALHAHAASVTIANANHVEGVFSTSIDGVPFQIWNDPLLGDRPAVLMGTRRCRNRPYTPIMALNHMKEKPNMRRHLLQWKWSKIGVFAVDIRSKKGDWAGKGTCRVYYITLTT